MTIIQGTIFYMFTFQINNYERQEKTKGNQRLQKVINMISYKEVEGHVREIPVVNFVDITTMESCITMYQLKRHAKLRLILQGKEIDKIEMKRMEKVTSSYANDLLSKYEQIKRETIHESENNCQKFLGLIKVDEKLIKQIFATLIIASVSAGGQSLISWLQSRSN
ncbi:hypothetical protein PPERSA_05432 [Pseudocohnilembus persalinus]|uniref:Uncharacterized protein n=1 Tax=Pseudocohnilembus persalinus TaxID=266149 RepID=A0A0V0R7Y4_PSEPJ|nr:hypothetical protein PPERSA_05432 [Pseudocohnilembus persalinus]|eukprot:KRX10612.1 hypothetical protein PPERSA_05432 [Pseudocohnilembus persalinus]